MNYDIKIQKSINYLLEQERKSTLALFRDRVRFIPLLKSGEAFTQSAAGQVIGLCERQSQRLWRIYQQEGLAGLQKSQHGGIGVNQVVFKLPNFVNFYWRTKPKHWPIYKRI